MRKNSAAIIPAIKAGSPYEAIEQMLNRVVRRYDYIDSMTVWLFKTPTQEIRDELRQLCGFLHDEPEKPMRFHFQDYRCKLQIHQPSAEAIDLLERITSDGSRYLINELDISMDLEMPNYLDACDLGKLIQLHIHDRWPGKQTPEVWYARSGMTFYTAQRNPIAIYYASLAKPTLRLAGHRPHLTGNPCVHIEVRASEARQVRRKAKVVSWSDLRAFDPLAFWSKYFRLAEVDEIQLGRQLNGRSRAKEAVPLWFGRPGFGYPDRDRRVGRIWLSGKLSTSLPHDAEEMDHLPHLSVQEFIVRYRENKRIRLKSVIRDLKAVELLPPIIILPNGLFHSCKLIPALRILHRQRKQRQFQQMCQ